MFSSHLRIYAQIHRQRFVTDLQDFIRFPSVSAQPNHVDDVKKCAVWLASHLRQIGLENVKVVPTPRHPIVYADWLHAPERSTVLVYGHYDVQPVDPLSEWDSPPFEPTLRGQDLYGRGASDDKGQMFTHIKAVESYLRTTGKLPVNVKCLFEGEEEIGSPNLASFLAQNKDAISADVVVLSDMWILAPDQPAITYAMRGALILELEVSGGRNDLHSGNFGGAIHNSLQVLSEIIAGLYDADGRITIPGFYERVRPVSTRERAYMASAGLEDRQVLRDAGISKGWGELGFTQYERIAIRPALTVNGIIGGYQGAGPKAVIPARSVAKFDFRLVPDQDPHDIERLFRQYIARVTPPTVRTAIHTHFVARPVLINRHHPTISAAEAAYRNGFGVLPLFLRMGGTIPVVSLFQRVLGLPIVLMGFALPDDRLHGPNEKFHLPNFYNGIATSIHFLAGVGALAGLKRQPARKNVENATAVA